MLENNGNLTKKYFYLKNALKLTLNFGAHYKFPGILLFPLLSLKPGAVKGGRADKNKVTSIYQEADL